MSAVTCSTINDSARTLTHSRSSCPIASSFPIPILLFNRSANAKHVSPCKSRGGHHWEGTKENVYANTTEMQRKQKRKTQRVLEAERVRNIGIRAALSSKQTLVHDKTLNKRTKHARRARPPPLATAWSRESRRRKAAGGTRLSKRRVTYKLCPKQSRDTL